jgi:co-chaperonin GroES (HSP10)
MKAKQTLSNVVMVKLDRDNDSIRTKTGDRIFIDTSFEPEKHVVLLGEVVAIPEKLHFSDKKNILPWDTDLEVKIGDRVLLYYLAVRNCLAKEQKKYIKEGNSTFIFIKYQNIFAVLRDKQDRPVPNYEIIPINGYLLVEPLADPTKEAKKISMEKLGLQFVDVKEKSIKDVVYGKVAYTGTRIKSYFQPGLSDENIHVRVGDKVVMKKVRDIPAEYEYHAKIDGGRKLYRVQRHDILAIL